MRKQLKILDWRVKLKKKLQNNSEEKIANKRMKNIFEMIIKWEENCCYLMFYPSFQNLK
jgi:hypothetical protein